MSNFMGVGIFWIGLNRADLGCWRLTLRAWLNGDTMLYETFVCFYVSKAKPLCFSFCSQMFDGVQRCCIYNIQNVCHANKQLSLCYFFSINVLKTLCCSLARP